MESDSINFKDIVKEVEKQNTWKPKEYDFMKSQRAELTKLLGVIPDYEDLKLIRAETKTRHSKSISRF